MRLARLEERVGAESSAHMSELAGAHEQVNQLRDERESLAKEVDHLKRSNKEKARAHIHTAAHTR